jgi:DNA-binding protein YbaB
MTKDVLSTLEDATRAAEDRVRRLKDIEERISGKRVSSSAPGNVITATVNGVGDLLELVIAPGSLRRVHADKLGSFIRKTVNSARAETARRQAEIVRREFGIDLGGEQSERSR